MSPELGFSMAAELRNSFWKDVDSFGFSRRGQYIGERAMSVDARGAHTMSRRGQGGRGWTWCGCRGPPIGRMFWLLQFSGVLGLWELFQNFLRTLIFDLLLQFTDKTDRTGTRHLVNRLVPENIGKRRKT